ncbi:hypothetical protein FRC06_004570 [Ceratobasidium sp. 370]|nr:hypothetical protein FRC06_004570 [Ceratobasidium sp. 370]
MAAGQAEYEIETGQLETRTEMKVKMRNKIPSSRDPFARITLHLGVDPFGGTGSNPPRVTHCTRPLAKTDLPTAIAFITTVRPYIEPYIEPYVEPLLWRGIGWALGDAERPSDAVREVERFKQQQREKEKDVMETLGPYIYHERADEVEKPGNEDLPGSSRASSSSLPHPLTHRLSFPSTQLAFVLNLEQHWFTLRRFGHRHGKGFWFNLNSFLSAPEWVGNTYLAMVLQQAEQEGYSVFVVRPVDASNPEHGLPETEADLLAETLNESAQEAPPPPQGFSLAGSTGGSMGTGGRPGVGEAVGGSTAGERSSVPGLENEDVELQRALQASLAAGYGGGGGVVYDFPDDSGPSRTGAGYHTTQTASSTTGSRAGLGLGYGGDRPPSRRTPPAFEAPDPPTPEVESSDPVAASAARARARLEQMQREQAAAMQVMGTAGYGFGAGMDEAVDADGARRRREAAERVRRAREEEEDQIRLAMAESLRAHTSGPVVEEDDPDYFVTPPSTTRPLPGSFPAGSGAGGNRHYDDEDAELQAALRASLEASGPVRIPSEPPRPVPAAPVPAVPVVPAPIPAPASSAPVPASSAPAPGPTSLDDTDEEGEGEDEEEKAPVPTSKAEVADAEELRRRRLARFGG